MQTKHLYVLIHIRTKVRLACRKTSLNPPINIFTDQGGASFVDHLCYLCYFCLVFVMLLCASAY